MTLFVSCNENEEKMPSLTGSAGCSADTVSSSDQGPLFIVNGETVTRSDLPGDLKNEVYQNEFQAYSKNQSLFEEYSLRIYLAKKQGKLKDKSNPPELTDVLNIPEPSESEMKSLFEMSKGRLPPDTKFEGEIKKQISQYLKSQKVGTLFREEVAKMKKDGAYRSLIVGPIAPEINIDITGMPFTGPSDAKVTLIEVSDYTCGHCQRAHPEVKNILKKFEGKIKFVQANYPLRPEGLSGMLVKAAYCAQQISSDDFWKFHNATFDETSKPHSHAPGQHHDPSEDEPMAKIESISKAAGVSPDKIKKCVAEDATQKEILRVADHLSSKGISGTPVFILNNKKLPMGTVGLADEIQKLLD